MGDHHPAGGPLSFQDLRLWISQVVVCPTRLGVLVLNRVGVCELRMGWVCPLFRHRKYKVPADSKLLENSLFSPIFYRWIAVVLLEDASVC